MAESYVRLVKRAEELSEQWSSRRVRIEQLAHDPRTPAVGGDFLCSHFEVADDQVVFVAVDGHKWHMDEATRLIDLQAPEAPGDAGRSQAPTGIPKPLTSPSGGRATAFLRQVADDWESGEAQPSWLYLVRVERWNGMLEGEAPIFVVETTVFSDPVKAADAYHRWDEAARLLPLDLVRSVELSVVPDLPAQQVSLKGLAEGLAGDPWDLPNVEDAARYLAAQGNPDLIEFGGWANLANPLYAAERQAAFEAAEAKLNPDRGGSFDLYLKLLHAYRGLNEGES